MRVLRITTAGALLAALCACGGGGGSFNPFPGGGNSTPTCDPGTSVQIARPAPGSFASNVNSIEIVASGNNNTLYNTYQNWSVSVVAQNQFNGQTIPGGALAPTSDRNGPQPFASDFYYSSQLNSTLPSGTTWAVYLNENNFNGGSAFCNAFQVSGTFST